MTDWRNSSFPWRNYLDKPKPEDFDTSLFRVMTAKVKGQMVDKRAGQRIAVQEIATGEIRCFPSHWFD